MCYHVDSGFIWLETNFNNDFEKINKIDLQDKCFKDALDATYLNFILNLVRTVNLISSKLDGVADGCFLGGPSLKF